MMLVNGSVVVSKGNPQPEPIWKLNYTHPERECKLTGVEEGASM